MAAVYGLEEAIFLDAILFWYRTNRANNLNFRDGRWWTYNSIKALETVFPWWSAKQVRRIAASCREQGALIVGEFNQDRRDRSLWYTPSDGLLALYGLKSETGTCTCPDGRMQSPERADSVAQMGECNIRKPCSNHGGTDIPPYSPPEGDKPAPAPEPEDKPAPEKKPRRFIPPDVEQVRTYCRERGNGIDPEAFVDYYTSKGWTVGRSPMGVYFTAIANATLTVIFAPKGLDAPTRSARRPQSTCWSWPRPRRTGGWWCRARWGICPTKWIYRGTALLPARFCT